MNWAGTIALRAARAVCLTLVYGVGAHGQQLEVQIPISDVDDQALAIARSAAPGVRFITANVEFAERGMDVLELGGVTAAGVNVEVDLVRAGSIWRIDEVEREVSWRQVPFDVKVILSVFFMEEWRPDVIERSERPDGLVVYELEGKDAAGETLEMSITETGDVVTIEKNTAS